MEKGEIVCYKTHKSKGLFGKGFILFVFYEEQDQIAEKVQSGLQFFLSDIWRDNSCDLSLKSHCFDITFL